MQPHLSTGEIRSLMSEEGQHSALDDDEREMIQSIFSFHDTAVREIMVPRIDISAISDDMTIDDAIALTVEHTFTRLPVYQGSLDHMVGMVHARDLLPFLAAGDLDQPVRNAMRGATFVPETKLISELLREFRETKQTLAIVLDEYGGTAGLVTVEDLLEEIVGEIYDEFDIEAPPIEWIDARTVIVDGKLAIDTAGELIDATLPEGEYDTVGGLLYSRFGDVPARGESIDIDGVRLTVERLDGHRITKVRIELPDSPPAEPDEETPQ
jgi:CBS domain containing-hemolysin-like protein